MFIPLHDENPLRTIKAAYVSRALIVVTSVSFVLFQSGLVVDGLRASALGFGVIPAEFNLEAGLRDRHGVVPEWFTLFTYAFVHGSWMHLIGNMLFLWVFGDNVEDALGHTRFFVFYAVCGIAGGLMQAALLPTSEAPLLGASGAVAGVLAGYLVLHPKVKLWVLVLGRIPLRITAAWVIGAWIAFQVFNLVVNTNQQTAWWAHIGGMLAGAVLVAPMRRPGVPLFDRGVVN